MKYINNNSIFTNFDNFINTTKSQNNNQTNSFFDYIQNSLNRISYNQNIVDREVEKFQTNQPSNSLSDIMIDLQKSSLELQFLIQIRNKIVSSYQEIMSMQI